MPPIHPGELLKDELQEIEVSLNELSRALRVPMNRISAIVNGSDPSRSIQPCAWRGYFGTSPQYWLNLQTTYDVEIADQAGIEKEVLPRNAHNLPLSPS